MTNPYTEPGQWTRVKIGDTEIPGVIKIDDPRDPLQIVLDRPLGRTSGEVTFTVTLPPDEWRKERK